MVYKIKKPKYYLDHNGEFVIENYNFAKPFANFFPGIAGKYGIPMWVFYVNRGQAISSFGIKNKNQAILEFHPANKAWQLVSSQGFRTFIKINKASFYEPFHNGFASLGFNIRNRMSISPWGLRLEEDNLSLGLRVNVEYFNIPGEPYAGLSRIVTLKNFSAKPKTIQLLDGLPQIVPFGTSDTFLKLMSRTIEAWMDAEIIAGGAAFYKLDVDPTDRPEVVHINEGNFYLGFHYNSHKLNIIKPIVDPSVIFGPITDFSCPRNFLSSDDFGAGKKQTTRNKTPSAFISLKFKLAAGEEKLLYSLIGHMRSRKMLESSIKKITSPKYLAEKKLQNKQLIEELQTDISTSSSSLKFDLYAKQTYLDNILRGGYPLTVDTGKGKDPTVFYLYSRKHGDLERDYNKFQLQPSYFSQGNGNYRDINQNRRCDIWFNPDIKEENLLYFFNLLQADGFNPLVTKGITLILKEGLDPKSILRGFVEEGKIPKIASILHKPFTPADVLFFIEENKIKLNASYDQFLATLISSSLKLQEAEHTEGFWTDHWTYTIDLLENYLALYPEKLKEIVFDKKVFTFFDNSEIVRPRNEKYLLYAGHPRQLHSVAADTAKKEMIRKRHREAHKLRVQCGQGKIYETSLINKLLCLVANKLASLDPFGMGIEMEADKPNWFDALNGLPALFGSSLCETFELKRLILLINCFFGETGVEKIYVSEEIHGFLCGLGNLLKEWSGSSAPEKDYLYWNNSYSLKEDYRHKTKFGFSGNELEMEAGALKGILIDALKKIEAGIETAKDKKRNLYYSYFINEVAEYQKLKAPHIKPLKFLQKKLPLFLEGQVHALRLSNDAAQANKIHQATKASPLYDKKLKMYKVTDTLLSMPEEIGRCRVFTPGWLENESIWLHMEYKYLLELLKRGLYEEFYAEFKNTLIPFQKPQKYGRSILENSSFLVSSAFADKKLHGNGFVARLSGSTAEFLNIWLIMNLGPKPFFLNEKKELNLRFRPILSGWLFDKRNKTYAFNFLSRVAVVYHNPQRKDTFGRTAAKIKKIVFNDKEARLVELFQETIPAPYAEEIRSRLVKKIDLYLE
ncbi:MAG: cellobiose phosphorylase [Candidatus Omnitrophota bacterium]|nr:cellobiose phosphorylase [Candidatus Omnitrophota bacterium]